MYFLLFRRLKKRIQVDVKKWRGLLLFELSRLPILVIWLHFFLLWAYQHQATKKMTNGGGFSDDTSINHRPERHEECSPSHFPSCQAVPILVIFLVIPDLIVNMQTTAPLKARVLFAFQATKPGEMALMQGETVDILIRGPPGGWCKGVRGAFPTDYVEFLPPPPQSFGGNMMQVPTSNNLSNVFSSGSGGMMMNNSNNNMFPGHHHQQQQQQQQPTGNILMDSMLPPVTNVRGGGGAGLLDLNWGMPPPSAIDSMHPGHNRNTGTSGGTTATLLDMDLPSAGGKVLDLLQMDNLLTAANVPKSANSVAQLLDLEGSLPMGGPVDVLQPQRPSSSLTVNTINNNVNNRQHESGKINLNLNKSAMAETSDNLLSFDLPSPGKLIAQT